jgi:uracil-DNA glycosylase
MMSRWSQRQRDMLAAMGVRLFDQAAHEPPHAGVEPDGAPPSAPAVRAEPVPPMPVARADVAMLDWPALRERVAACRACALCESRKQTVFGVGHERARLMIVGEAPGEQEDLQGEPFVGQAGKLLDNMLRALGLARDAADAERAVFICNTLKCRPPRNRNPEPAETARCAPYLERQIELLQPKLLLAMGRFAAQALLGSDEAIGKLRGRVHQRMIGSMSVPVIVTYHPAYLLRTLADKARAWDDLCLAASVLELPA